MAKLLILTPEGQQQERELKPVNSLGRHPNNSIQLLDRIVSKEHCIIEARGPRYVLKDLGSLNGTFINGQKVIGEQALKDNDEISLGTTRLLFKDNAPMNPVISTTPFGPPQNAPPAPVPLQPPAPQPPQMPPPPAPPPNPPAAVAPPNYGGLQMPPPPQPYPGPSFPSPPSPPLPAPPVFGGAAQPKLPGPPGAAPAASPANPATQSISKTKVTIAAGMMESHIRTRIALAAQQFLPEKQVQDVETLRRDYEKLRVSYELNRGIGSELALDKLLEKILGGAFQLLPADRGVILLYDEAKELKPRAMLSRRQSSSDDDFIVSTSIIKQVEKDRVALLSSDAKMDPRFNQAHSIIMQGIRSSMAVPLEYKGELLGIMLLDSQISTNAFGEKDLQLFTTIANQASVFIENAKLAMQSEKAALERERFQRLLSPQIAQLVLDGKVEIKQGGEPRETTMLFSDIRGFTSMSEGMRAEDIVAMLNDYFERMVEILFRHEGTLDKFVGDEIMALFGAPVSHADDPVRAVRAAIEMLDSLRKFNEERKAQGLHGFEIGIGINTGQVVAGYLGSTRAMQYTVIGAPVNLAARLCSQAKGMQVIISEATWLRVRHSFEVRELEPVKPKGIAQPVRIFEVLRERPAPEVEYEDHTTMAHHPRSSPQ